jgi:hypothetical protein
MRSRPCSLSGEVSTQGGVSALAAEVLEAANGGGDPPVGGAAERLRAVTAELAQLRQEAAAQEVEQRDLLAAAEREAVEGAASAQVQSAAYRRVRSQLEATKRRLAAASTRYKRMVESLGEEEDRVAAAKRVGGDVQRIKQRLAAFKEAQRRDDDVKAAEL